MRKQFFDLPLKPLACFNKFLCWVSVRVTKQKGEKGWRRIYVFTHDDLRSSLEGIPTAILKRGNHLNLNRDVNKIHMTLTIDKLTFWLAKERSTIVVVVVVVGNGDWRAHWGDAMAHLARPWERNRRDMLFTGKWNLYCRPVYYQWSMLLFCTLRPTVHRRWNCHCLLLGSFYLCAARQGELRLTS